MCHLAGQCRPHWVLACTKEVEGRTSRLLGQSASLYCIVDEWMKRLLTQYLVLAIAAQFVMACLLDFAGLCFAGIWRDALGPNTKLPDSTAFVLSIRHWAFIWPVAVVVFALVLFRKARSEEIWLHFFGSIMLVAVAVITVALWCFFIPLFDIFPSIGDSPS